VKKGVLENEQNSELSAQSKRANRVLHCLESEQNSQLLKIKYKCCEIGKRELSSVRKVMERTLRDV